MKRRTNNPHFFIFSDDLYWWTSLNQNPEKIVIAPNKCFNDPSIDISDLIPESWIGL